MEQDVLVTVVCCTYNHRDYIKEAIEGILLQNVSFFYEIIIHDDASTDGTVDIIREYEKNNLNMIRVIYETENQYKNADSFVGLIQQEILAVARGKYIMFCEGDDYWIDPTKMQRQIDYLEHHHDCAMVVHNAAVLNMENIKISVMNDYNMEKDLSPEEIINHPFGCIATGAMTFRKKYYHASEKFFREAGVGDYTIHLYCMTKGKIHYIDRIMSVYRFGQSGSWQASQISSEYARFSHCVNMIRFLDYYDKFTHFRYTNYVTKELSIYTEIAAEITWKLDISSNTREISLSSKIDYQKYLDEILRISNLIYNPTYYDKNVKSFIESNKNILIMGAGKYAAVLAGQLKNNGVDFDGFVVSPDQNVKEVYLGKPVYYLDSFPYEKERVGILVGIRTNLWEEVESMLLKYGISKYYCPYLFVTERLEHL